MDKEIIKKIAGPARWLLTAALLALTVWQVPPREWLTIFPGLHWGWVLLAALLMGSIVLINSWKWLLIMKAQGLNPGYRRVFFHYTVGYFFNSFITGTGDIKRAADSGRELKAIPEAVASVLADRWTGVIGQITLAFGTLAIFFLNTPAIWPAVVSALLMLAVLTGIFLWFEHVPENTTAPEHSLFWWIFQIRRAFSGFRRHRFCLLFSLVLSFVGPTLLIFIHVALARAMGCEPSLWAMIILIPTISVFAQLPITINGFGIQDYFMVTLFNGTLEAGQAVALSLLFHALRLLAGTSGGILYAACPNFGLKRALAGRETESEK